MGNQVLRSSRKGFTGRFVWKNLLSVYSWKKIHLVFLDTDLQNDKCKYVDVHMGLNTWCSANSISFKSHSISVTFKFCAVRVALCALEPRSTDSLGTQHRAIFHALIITTPSIQAARCVHIIIGDIFNILNTFLLILWLHYIMALKYMRNNKLLTLLFIKEGLCCNM